MLCYVILRHATVWPFVSSDGENADWLTFVINLKAAIPVPVIIGGAHNV